MYMPAGGQDHLGLGSVVTDRILPRLSPGINVLTIHPRYWSFYSFVLSGFWSRDLPRTKAAFREWYRPLECIFSIGCELCADPGHRGSPGWFAQNQRFSGRTARNLQPEVRLHEDTHGRLRPLLRQCHAGPRLGSPGGPTARLPVDAVTPVGQLVADAFRNAISQTAYYQDWIEQHDEAIPAEVVREYAKKACLCQLRKKSAPDRKLLVDAFLHCGNVVDAAARRSTLQFMCELSAQSADSPIDSRSFRRLVYYRTDYSTDDFDGPTFVPTPANESTPRRWRLYQAREYYNASINEMWRRLAHWGLARDGDNFPVPMAEVMASLDGIDFASMASDLEVDLPRPNLTGNSSFSDLLEWVRVQGRIRWRPRCPLGPCCVPH